MELATSAMAAIIGGKEFGIKGSELSGLTKPHFCLKQLNKFLFKKKIFIVLLNFTS
jgi:hypothetical protein